MGQEPHFARFFARIYVTLTIECINIMNLQDLSPSEKIILAEELWDSVAADEQLFSLTEDQRRELDARLASYTANPEAGDSWKNVRNRVSD